MPSAALHAWKNDSAARLDELLKIHQEVAGAGRGRPWGTEQLNRSLFVALVAQFQSYSVALHDLAVDVHVDVAPAEQQALMRRLMTLGRALESKNPRTDHLGADFSKVGLALIKDLKAIGPASQARLRHLDLLIDFRNAIAHGNEAEISAMALARGIKPTKAAFVRYRGFLNQLAPTMDRTVSTQLASVLNIRAPW